MRSLIISGCLSLICLSCENKPIIGVTVSKYKPVLIARSSLPNSVFNQPPSDISNPGKYLVNGNYLYVVERYKGVHIFDNTNPSAPKNMVFVTVPGIETISILNKTLYVDNSIDIVGLDISNPATPVLTSRIPNAIPQPGPPDGLPLDSQVNQNTWPHNSVVVNWVKILG